MFITRKPVSRVVNGQNTGRVDTEWEFGNKTVQPSQAATT